MNSINAVDFEFVRSLVYRESAISIEPDMQYLVESRLSSLVRKTEYEGIAELVGCLRNKREPSLTQQVVDAMTTNETSFFRDSHPFDTLCQEVLPVIARSHAEPIRIWCAACSTGQEAYTIAMAIHEQCAELVPRVSILGTDICSEVVSRAESGTYSRLEVNRGLPARLLARYFVQKGLSWQVVPQLRDMVGFRTLNLIHEWDGLGPMDIIFLRNVLIYFDPAMKSAVLQKVGQVLKPEGCLFLGLSETTLNLNTHFRRISTDNSHYYKFA